MIGDRWGVTHAETAARYVCDDLIPNPTFEAWRGISIKANPTRVWAWLVQVRIAPYSYDWIDNLGRRSPRDLRWLADPEVGDPFSSTGGRPVGRIVSVEHQHHLTAQIMGTIMTYQLTSRAREQTRLVLKIVGNLKRPTADLLCIGDLLMARRQLLNIRNLSERSAFKTEAG